MGVDGISRIGRATQGVRVIQLEEGDLVVSAIRAAEDDAPVDEKEPTEAPKTNGNPEDRGDA